MNAVQRRGYPYLLADRLAYAFAIALEAGF
jgi:hypothetical protein